MKRMEVSEKPKIEGLYPLTLHQQGLLFHHLSGAEDIGLLIVQCKLNGKLDFELLQSAWQMNVQQHEVLRSSVHWKKIDTPVLLVRPEVIMNWNKVDWSSISTNEQENKLVEFKNDLKKKGLQLDKNPLTNITLVELGSNSYYLLWQCHHLLLDGWSSNIILKDFMKFYDMLSNDKEVLFESIPSYKSYLNWRKNSSGQEAENFWKETLNGFDKPLLFQSLGAHLQKRLEVKNMVLTVAESEAIKALAKKNHITINSMFQGAWALLLSQYFDKEDVVFGTTVSGRSSGFPKIDLMSGMFTNVIPVRAILTKNLLALDCFKKIQLQQQLARNHDRFTVEELLENKENFKGATLFDSLFVFENFPQHDITGSDLKMTDFISGISTTYPLTLIIRIDDDIKIDLIYDGNAIEEDIPTWLIENFRVCIEELLTKEDINVINLRKELNTAVQLNKPSKSEDNSISKKEEYIAPSTETESLLVKLWEEVFAIDDISINDNFFSLGGKSLIAVKMFARLSEKHSVKLPPTTLLEHPTIAEIGKLIDGGDNASDAMEFMVPLRKKGSKAPLFCVHAGGGHVFFYNNLPKYLNAERPVYAVQPSGIDGANKLHNSIAEMTADYLLEIKKVQPKGPYHILVYCFGTAVGIEMTRQLNEANEKAHIIVMDTMALQEKVTADRLVMRTKNFVKRFADKPLDSLDTMVTDRVKRYLKPIWTNLFGNIHDKNLEALKQNLVSIYTQYEWHKFKGQIDLVLTQKASESLNDEIIESWQNLTEEVSIINVAGNHRTLFEEPDVRFVGEKLEESMVSYEKL